MALSSICIWHAGWGNTGGSRKKNSKVHLAVTDIPVAMETVGPINSFKHATFSATLEGASPKYQKTSVTTATKDDEVT